MNESRIGVYRIIRKLGEGGMGAVFEAIHEEIERRVAIKVLHPEFARNPECTSRFFNEARAVNRVDHPGLVQVSDYGRLADGTTYIVMEFLNGESLGSRLNRLGGSMAVEETIAFSRQVADALAAAHDKGIVHRDLKPDNVMIIQSPRRREGERTKVLDFGIAKLVENGADHFKTKTNALMGTPTYMSPEQCRGAGGVDSKSDVYSLGVMMYRMLAGRLPLAGDGLGEILSNHMYAEPPALQPLAPLAPSLLVELIHRMLRKDKQQRPDMNQVVAELDAVEAQTSHQATSPVHAQPNVLSGPFSASRPSGELTPGERLSTLRMLSGQARSSPKGRVAVAGSSAILVAILGLGTGALQSPRRTTGQSMPMAAKATTRREIRTGSAEEKPLQAVVTSPTEGLVQPADHRAASTREEQVAAVNATSNTPLLQSKAGKVAALVKQGRKKLTDGDLDDATNLFLRAVDLEPRSPEAVGGLAQSYFEQEDFRLAARQLAVAVQLSPGRSVAYQEMLAQALYKTGQFKEATEVCHKVLKQRPASEIAKKVLRLAEGALWEPQSP